MQAAPGREHAVQGPRSGEWSEKPNYFDIKVWGAQGENCAQYLSGPGLSSTAGSSGASGRRRTAASATVEVVADTVQFLGGRAAARAAVAAVSAPPASSHPVEAPADVGAVGADDDIPF